MKILLAVDDGPHSQYVVDAVLHHRWPNTVQFTVLVVLEPIDTMGEGKGHSASHDSFASAIEHRKQHAEHLSGNVRKKIHETIKGCNVHCVVKNGHAAEEILAVAHEWGADRIVIGAHTRDVCPHNALGSVSRAVAHQANCSVEIVRPEAVGKNKETELVSAGHAGHDHKHGHKTTGR